MKLTFTDKRVLVLGLGDTGLSVLRWLSSQGALLSVADTRQSPPGLEFLRQELPQVRVHLGPFSAETFEQAELIVASPGVPLSEPQVYAALQRGIPVVGDIELFAQNKAADAKVIAITGSNGKSTVTALVGEMCKAAGLKTVVAGNIGLPVLDALMQEKSSGAPDVYVLELSSFQLETTHTLVPDVATVLNISEDHMDRYHSLAEYAGAKMRIFHGSGVQVLNRDDAWSRSMALSGRHVVTFGLDLPPSPEDFGVMPSDGDAWLMHGHTGLIHASEMHIPGRHNASNALAALALCRGIGLEFPPLVAALRAFKGLPHRVEWVDEIEGVAFYDDSKGTNVGATCAALSGLANDEADAKVVLIAGGDGKGQDFAPLRQPVVNSARAVVLMGKDASVIGEALKDAGVPLLHAASLPEAVRVAYTAAKPHDAVLLSPACASFDMFRNYVHRAEVFVGAVKALKQDPAPHAEAVA
ncbi:MAG TPA: UDP-N-acetylmuramoyl-L-alanine--D-glutamate ligase [Methylophilaceae bacterium]|nr:UDP-N-acetylmuramoyl-L-alanine--D-glutamate ligase [Methylophilaceae bacterium]